MLEPPELADHTIIDCLRSQYGLAVADLAFLPLGHDSSAWVYHVQTDAGGSYFLKVRTSVANEPSLLVPRYLQDHGVAHAVAPLPATSRQLWAAAGDFALILYPFIDGTTGMEHGMSDAQWIDYGASLRQIHTTVIAPDLARIMRHELFVPEWAAMVKRLDAHISTRTFDDPAMGELATFWQERRDEIRALASRAEELGQRLAPMALPFVICHADIHTNNVLLDTEQQAWIVDWDETILAPKERDLMFVVGGISSELVGPREEELFFQGYGSTTVDPLALAYYRHAWAVGDIGSFGEEIFFRPDLGAKTRHRAVRLFLGLFQPGEIVALAHASDHAAT